MIRHFDGCPPAVKKRVKAARMSQWLVSTKWPPDLKMNGGATRKRRAPAIAIDLLRPVRCHEIR